MHGNPTPDGTGSQHEIPQDQTRYNGSGCLQIGLGKMEHGIREEHSEHSGCAVQIAAHP